jgi:ribosomal RNA-processing protein 12
LRTSILQGLRTLVTTNKILASSALKISTDDTDTRGFGISSAEAQQNIDFLTGIASNMISVLFNVFNGAASEERGLVGEVIGIWLEILPPKVIILFTPSIRMKLALTRTLSPCW